MELGQQFMMKLKDRIVTIFCLCLYINFPDFHALLQTEARLLHKLGWAFNEDYAGFNMKKHVVNIPLHVMTKHAILLLFALCPLSCKPPEKSISAEEKPMATNEVPTASEVQPANSVEIDTITVQEFVAGFKE